MPGKTYSAGTIFLQVVPVFGDVQREITREAKDMNKALGDEMEKGGKEAGERASKAINKELEKGSKDGADKAVGEFQKRFNTGIQNIQKSLEPLDIRLEDKGIKKQFDDIHKDLDALKKRGEQGFVYEADIRDAEKKFRVLAAQLEGLRDDVKMTATLDVDKAAAEARKLEGTFDNLRKAADIEIRLDRKVADRTLGQFEKRFRDTARKAADALGDSMDREAKSIRKKLEDLANTEIGIDMSAADARRTLDELEARLKRLALTSPEIDVKINAGRAEAELAGVTSIVNALDGKDIDIKVDVDAGAAAAKVGLLKSLFSGGAGSDAAANSFRSFNAVVLAAVTLLPALVPVIGAVGGALLALLPILASVGAGLGAMLIGFSGIGDAVGALGDQADNAAKDSAAAGKTMSAASYAVADAKTALADAERNSAQASADAARAVADARRAAADAIESALDRQRDAQQAYRDSVDEVRDAEQALREARQRAQAEQADTTDKIRQNALDIREAQLAAFDTTNAFNSVMADGSSTAYDKEAAEVAMLQARERLHELRDDQAELAKDKKKQDKDGVNGSETVQNAQDDLTAAIEAQQEAQENLGDAAEAVKDARIEGARRVADAVRNQQRAEADGARSVARAQEALRRANEGYGEALQQTGDLGSASMQKVEEAMGKLGPSGRKFARFLFSLRDDFYRIRDAVQKQMLPAVQRAFESLIKTYGPQFGKFMAKMGGGVGRFFELLAASLEGPAWKKFFGVMKDLGPKMAAEFGVSTINWLETFANIMTTVAPFAERFSNAMMNVSDAVNRWSASDKGVALITGFMEYAERIGPKVMSFLEAFVGAAINLAAALAPWGELILDVLTGILDWIANMDTKTLGFIVSSIIAMVVAFQVTVGIVAAVAGGMTVFATAAGAAVFGIVLVVGLLAALALRFEGVRDALRPVVAFLGDHADVLLKVAAGIAAVILAMRLWKAIIATTKAVQLGMAAATYGAAGAAYAQGFAAKAAYIATRIWMGVTKAMAIAQAIMTAVINGTALAMVRQKIATVALWVALRAYSIGMRLATAWTWALNVAQRANIFGLIIALILAAVVAIVLLWKKNEGFRNVIIKVWNAVKDAIVSAWHWISDAAVTAWNLIGPVIKALGDAILMVWTDYIKPYLGKIRDVWVTTFRVLKAVWTNVLWPVIKRIGSTILSLWKLYFKVYFTLIRAAWKVLWMAFKYAWNNVLKPLFKAFGVIVGTMWKLFIKPVFSALSKGWDLLAAGFKFVYNKTIKPIIDAFIDLMGGKKGLKAKFETVVGAISKLWDGLKKVFAAPIKFVLETVLNNGLIAGFNKIAKFVKMDGIDKIDIPAGIDNAYATGGVLPGYTPGQDVHHFSSPTGGRLHLSGGEAIMRPEVTAAVGKGWVDQVNGAARAEGVAGVRKMLFGGSQAYAKGGIFFPVPGGYIEKTDYNLGHDGVDINHAGDSGPTGTGGAISFYSATSGTVESTGYDRGYGNAIFVNSPYGELVYGHSYDGSIAVKPGQSVTPGQYLAKIGTTGNSSGPHLHFGFPGGTFTQAMALLAGSDPNAEGHGGGGSGFHFPGWILEVAKNPLKYVANLVKKPLDSLRDKFGNGEMIEAIAKLPLRPLEAMAKNVWNILPGGVKRAVGFAGDAASWVTHGIVGGLDAVVPGDGIPFVGGKGYAPAESEAAYRKGGVLPYNGTMMYDAGGYLPPGLTSVVNLTGKPEPVFTHEQFADMEGGGNGGFTYAPTLNGSDLTPEDLMDDLEFTVRKMGRRGGGKYEGVR